MDRDIEDLLDRQPIQTYMMTRRHFLVYKAMQDTDCGIMLAIEAVASTAIEHPEWDMDELRTLQQWEEVK